MLPKAGQLTKVRRNALKRRVDALLHEREVAMETKRVGHGTASGAQLDPTSRAGAAVAGGDAGKVDGQKTQSQKGVDVAVSERARQAAKAREKATEIARNTPDVREDRVRELRERIQSGQYQVDANRIADGMMREAILDKLSTMPDE